MLELLFAFAVVAVVLTLGVPAFSDLIRDSRRTEQVNLFVHSIHLAKNEAAKRARYVTLCKSANGRQCTSLGQWHQGWLVFVNRDRDRPPQVDPSEEILYVRPPYPHGTIHGNRVAFTFRPFRRRATNGTLVFCDLRGPASARAVVVSYTGRPRISHKDSRGRPLDCP